MLLNQLYKEGFKGGNVKGADDEEWAYRSSGVLRFSIGGDGLDGQVFQWDGENLRPKSNCSQGYGSWDGVTLRWFKHVDDKRPQLEYVYQEDVREYHSSDGDAQRTWKWTRHFLARKEGRGEWIMEGQVPEPVVMLLQLMTESRFMSDQA